MSNFLLEGPGGLPQVKLGGALNTNKPVTIGTVDGGSSTATLTVGTGGITNQGVLTTAGIVNTGTSTGTLSNVVTVTSTTQLTQSQSGSIIVLNAAAGFTTTLPVTPVVGTKFTFMVATSVTSSTLKIITGSGTQLLQGVITSATTTASVFESVIGTSNISVAMNGTTTGGLVGSQFEFTCLSATLWQVFGTNFTSGTTATPFATS
jgi:hypothetical protein